MQCIASYHSNIRENSEAVTAHIMFRVSSHQMCQCTMINVLTNKIPISTTSCNHTDKVFTIIQLTAPFSIYLPVSDHTCQHDRQPSQTSVESDSAAVIQPTLNDNSNDTASHCQH